MYLSQCVCVSPSQCVSKKTCGFNINWPFIGCSSIASHSSQQQDKTSRTCRQLNTQIHTSRVRRDEIFSYEWSVVRVAKLEESWRQRQSAQMQDKCSSSSSSSTGASKCDSMLLIKYIQIYRNDMLLIRGSFTLHTHAHTTNTRTIQWIVSRVRFRLFPFFYFYTPVRRFCPLTLDIFRSVFSFNPLIPTGFNLYRFYSADRNRIRVRTRNASNALAFAHGRNSEICFYNFNDFCLFFESTVHTWG